MAHTVRDAMTEGAIAVRPGTPLTHVARIMRDENIGTVLVADGGRLIGLITDRDIALRAVADGAVPRYVDVADLCTKDPVCVDLDDGTDRATALMRRHAIRRLPVTSGDRPVGVISIGDLTEQHDPHSALAKICRAAPSPDHGPVRR
ncbi:CBS domain-containing protein [Streptomyces sp. SID5785]|uniref:CBS domain-containing protein n=1 Tax=Streptomyces sp. SID5785 TaxID=2690309 RepID=UPI001360FD62|nr:CBS domain-containing protein [Streptomyces sp. SID5785]MZD06093.1 CBS domain-containing protein [Streptomyces sp. SID5785]